VVLQADNTNPAAKAAKISNLGMGHTPMIPSTLQHADDSAVPICTKNGR
jgi:hypothetical protein